MSLPYIPVSCELYESLEERAIGGHRSDILYRDAAGNVARTRDRIMTLSVQDKVEYMHLEEGTVIRLDALIECDGMAMLTNTYHQQRVSEKSKHE